MSRDLQYEIFQILDVSPEKTIIKKNTVNQNSILKYCLILYFGQRQIIVFRFVVCRNSTSQTDRLV